METPTLYPRFMEQRLSEALEDSPVVLVHGPRQCGKTTLARTKCDLRYLLRGERRLELDGRPLASVLPWSRGYEYRNFEEQAVRDAAEDDLAGFVANLPERVVLDEVQRNPRLFAALKIEVDRRRVPGRFLLTGSTNILLVPALSDSLAGRMEIVHLHPLAQCEILGPFSTDTISLTEGGSPGFLDSLFGDGFASRQVTRLGAELAERIAAGGYPAALARPDGTRRARWYLGYLDALIQRDVRDLARIRALDVMPRLLKAVAANTARPMNVARLAGPFAVSAPTIRDYLTLLERVFLLHQVPAFHDNRLKRLTKAPRLHFGDTGLACALLNADEETLAADRTLLGQMVETFVFQELVRQASWAEGSFSFSHYRDKDQTEVDIVIERGVVQVAGVEVKAGATVRSSDFRGLRRLREVSGDRFASGVVLYDGEYVLPFGDRLRAVPMRLLWETPKPAPP